MPTNLPTLRRGFRACPSLGAAALLLGGLLSYGCGGDDALEGASASPVPVLVRQVDHLDRPGYVALSGDVVAWRTANVGFMVPGVVQSVGADEGDRVEKGETLATLDPADYEINVEMAAAQRERAEDEHARAKKVFDQNGIPANDFDKAETALRLARAQEAMARKKLADSKLASPLTGVVAYRGVQPGEQAGPGHPVFTVVQVDPAQIRAGVPETEIGSIAVGQKAVITIPALGGTTFEGTVRLVGIAADPASRTYTVKVRVDNAQGTLRPGMIAEVRIEKNTMVRTVTVPGEAIVRDTDGITRVFVYYPDEQRVHQKRVEVGTVYGQEVEIKDGLQGTEMVVIGGQNRVREGSPVVARTEGDATPASGGSAQGDTAAAGTEGR